MVDANLCCRILAANESAPWLNGVAPALMIDSHLHLFWLQSSMKKLRQSDFGCQHPRTLRAKVAKILRSGTDAVLRHQKNLSCVWISYRGSRGKAAYINVTSFGQVRTCDHAFLPCDWNSIRHVSFRFFRRNSRSAQHSNRRCQLHFLNHVWYLLDRRRRRPGNV